MSESTLAPVTAQRGRLASIRPTWNRLNPLEALERGLGLFQSTFTREAWRYYTGAAPLVFCFIPMWVIDGQIRISDGALLLQAVLLTAAYLLRARMVASYVQHVRKRAFGVPVSKPAGVAGQAAATGRLLTWKIAFSAATLATVPTVAGASWFYSACQFASLEAQEDASERHSFGGCLALASQWFAGGLLLFLMLFPLWIAVWLNGFMLAILIPALLHSIFGVNTLLSTQMGIYALLRSSAFWLSLFAGAWLALDPIVKCTFIAVYQHLRSRREGDDLKGALASLPREQQKKAELITSSRAGRKAIAVSLFVLAALLLGASETASAGAPKVVLNPGRTETADDSPSEARVQKLRQAMDEESQRAIYRWHDADHPSSPTWLDRLLGKIGRALEGPGKAFLNFLRKLWPRGLAFSPDQGKGGGWRLKDIRLWLELVLVLTIGGGVALFLLRRRREAAQLSVPVTTVPLPDLSVAVANERSEEAWFALAERLEGDGELRLALRAAYLALLAGLAQREWLTIRRDRTNREYLDEFTRRWRRRPQAAVELRLEIPEKLRSSLRLFDSVWYGSHGLTPAAVVAYRQGQRELLNHV
ncbi:MAG TPA: DUF4129 domain-containing protein [Candidatus Acidoferrum sp.]|nr:DUF4129 domain-containing protein [Candidatus Acidoferrum sp.]